MANQIGAMIAALPAWLRPEPGTACSVESPYCGDSDAVWAKCHPSYTGCRIIALCFTDTDGEEWSHLFLDLEIDDKPSSYLSV